MVRLKFSITLAYQIQDRPCDFIFNIQPAFTERQCVFDETLTVSQAVPIHALVNDADGSRFLRLQANAGSLEVSYQGTVDINHFQEDPAVLREMPVADLPLDALSYVYPSRYCQSDKLRALANYEFGHMSPGYDRVLAIQRWVNNRTRFLTGSSGGATSALDTLVDHAGVCRDFAHLMIAICRALNMPARFVSGIDYGADPSLGPTDFHAYVEVMLSGRWYLFDPSGVAPPMGLIRLGTGRDAADIPFVTVFGNVFSEAPRVIIDAITDPSAGLQLPVYQRYALSSAGRSCSAYTSFNGATS
ncbi:MAG: transglutaminase family protein [Pseudohongiella sp.]|nr:transglutaminase family protein [Pseudohongiella sp.]